MFRVTKLARRERKTMNGNAKKDIALGAIALGVGVALGAVFGNEKTRKSIVDSSKSLFSNYRQKRA
jgi:hypothetical protein